MNKFNSWTIKEKFRGTGRHYMAIAQCDCGTIRTMRSDAIASGKSKSCGCKTSENMSKALTQHGGKLLHPGEYRSWKSMRARCNSITNKKYPDYGGRGISVCPRWNDFELFLLDMGPRPDGTSIGRIENNGNYEPSNCRWETPKQQANNTRRSLIVEVDGESKTIAQWSDKTGIKRGTLQRRFHCGATPAQILSPV